MSTYRIDGFKFDRQNLDGLDPMEASALARYMTAREREINSVEAASFVCAGGPFDGQSISLTGSDAGSMASAQITVGQHSGRYEVRQPVTANGNPTGGPAHALWVPAGQVAGGKAVTGPLCSNRERTHQPRAEKPLSRGFGMLAEFLASLDVAPVGQFVTFVIGRMRYTVRNTAESVARLRAQVLAKKKWFADKLLSVARAEPAQVEAPQELEANPHQLAAADAVAQVVAHAVAAAAIANAQLQAQGKARAPQVQQEARELVTACAGTDSGTPWAGQMGRMGPAGAKPRETLIGTEPWRGRAGPAGFILPTSSGSTGPAGGAGGMAPPWAGLARPAGQHLASDGTGAGGQSETPRDLGPRTDPCETLQAKYRDDVAAYPWSFCMPDTLLTGAELRTLRESVGMSNDELGSVVNVQGRSIKYWESGRSGVPNDVATVVMQLDAQFTRTVQEMAAQVRQSLDAGELVPGDEFVLMRYATTEDLHQFRPDLRGMPASAHGALIGRVRFALQAMGLVVRVVYMQPEQYHAWRRAEGLDDGEVTRSHWASLQVPAQALPRPGTTPRET